MKEHAVERIIMWGDLDSLGIVFYPRYYEWIDGCAHLFFESLGIGFGTLCQDRQILFGLVETACRYFKPGRYHQKIQIVTRIEALEDKTITLKHLIKKIPENDLMVEGTEKRICMNVSDPDNLRAVNMPDDIYAILEDAAKN